MACLVEFEFVPVVNKYDSRQDRIDWLQERLRVQSVSALKKDAQAVVVLVAPLDRLDFVAAIAASFGQREKVSCKKRKRSSTPEYP